MIVEDEVSVPDSSITLTSSVSSTKIVGVSFASITTGAISLASIAICSSEAADWYNRYTIKEIIKNDLGQDTYNSIINLSEPVAAASIAQVHFAKIKIDGQEKDLAIKILRPNIHVLVNEELDALMFLAFLVESIFKNTKRLKLVEVINLLKEITNRLGFLNSVGLAYLSLDRLGPSLSGGESQRIRLASQVGSELSGVIYILDEPSIGLHQRDNERLLHTLQKLRDLGNTVIVVEHDEEAILIADHVIDIGPNAGINGGKIIAQGTPEEIKNNTKSITGNYLSGIKSIPIPKKRRKINPNKHIIIRGATGNNLQNVDVEFPLGILTCVTGVSGGGKSTLVIQTLQKSLSKILNGNSSMPAPYKSINGISQIDKIIDIDQSPIGRTPRSNPATYTGAFNHIRDWFAGLPEAKARGYLPGRFSFNVKGGRCEACQGDGVIKIEMHFLPDVYVQCDQCKGKRYNRETLEVKWKDFSISDVLDMTVSEGAELFKAVPLIYEKLKTLERVGLGYIKIGQRSTTLSGGEAQRIKLAKELSRKGTGRTIYILDEPTTGLHFHDIKKLLEVMQELVDNGNTMIVIEHNLDVIKTADHIIDLGPEGGDKGGYVVAEGTPEEVSKIKESHTGTFLKKLLSN